MKNDNFPKNWSDYEKEAQAYFDYWEDKPKAPINKKHKKKEQSKLFFLLLLIGLGYYFLVYLPDEKATAKKEKQQANISSNKSPEELQAELEEDAWQKGRIWELPAYSWADRIVKNKSSSLLGEYLNYASLFPDGDRNEKFYFSRAANYIVFFPPSLKEYYDKGKEIRLENCKFLEKEKELILSDEIKSWIERVIENPTRGEYKKLGNNALFYGAPGTGKTETMRNICVKANKYPLISIAGSDLTPTDSDQKAEILPLHKFAYTISELEWSLVNDYGFEREENGEVRYILFVDEANQISNNSLIFQSNGLKILKDCLESTGKDEETKNLWVFATNHRDQVEKATFRPGRLSNPLDFTWNWQVFKDFCENNDVDLPERWKEKNHLTPEDEKWLAEFNVDIFNLYFLGKDEEVSERKEFWNLFIKKNPDACYIPKNNQEEKNNENEEENDEVEIEIGEFLEFFWHIKEKYSTSFDGTYTSVQKSTTEKILETGLKMMNSKLDRIIEELEENDLEDNTITKMRIEINLLKDAIDKLK